MTDAGIVLMRNLRWISVVVAAWLSTGNVATAFVGVERRPPSPRVGTFEDDGLKIVATGVFGNTTSSGRSSSPQLPVVRGRPKVSFRVGVSIRSVGDCALLKHPACP